MVVNDNCVRNFKEYQALFSWNLDEILRRFIAMEETFSLQHTRHLVAVTTEDFSARLDAEECQDSSVSQQGHGVSVLRYTQYNRHGLRPNSARLRTCIATMMEFN